LSFRRTTGRGRGSGKRCPECGVELKAGLKYCDFCGTKVLADAAAPKPGGAGGERTGLGRPGGGPWRTAADAFKAVVAVCLVAGAFVFLGKRLGQREAPPPPHPVALDAKRQAGAACEERVRREVREPFRVIAFRSALVAEEKGGYVVSGTVDLQSLSGELQRKRYWCSVQPDARARLVAGEGRLY
jgi:hypothetical protein